MRANTALVAILYTQNLLRPNHFSIGSGGNLLPHFSSDRFFNGQYPNIFSVSRENAKYLAANIN